MRELPVLNYSPFRRYPTKATQQSFADETQVCYHCVSGVCCSSEDPIALTGFDILRLSAFFNMSPADFMLKFTQDKFEGEDSDERRRHWHEDPKSSIVTWLRRRDNHPTSPCLFLKFVSEDDGTPRRICSIHDGRPLSCREYYYSECRPRNTGELAGLLAEGYEKVRDGEITEPMTDAELRRFGQHDYETATLAQSMEYNFWVEMKRVLNMEQANIEGANSYDMAAYQDPIEVKLNRLLSSKYLRFEEKYGLRPRDEQLMPYTSGLNFAQSAEYERIMTLLDTSPTSGLFQMGNFPHWIGLRTMVPGVRHADVFPTIPEAEIEQFIGSLAPVQLFPAHDLQEVRSITLPKVYAAILAGYNHLLRLSSYIVALAPVLEFEPEGTIETDLLKMLASFETSLNPYLARNPHFEPARQRLAKTTVELLESETSETASHGETFETLRTLNRLQPLIPTLAPDLAARFRTISRTLDARLEKDELELYVEIDNPIAARQKMGRRLSGKGANAAWDAWCEQALDMRYAATAGFKQADLNAYFSEAVSILETITPRRSYRLHLYDIVKHLAYSMSDFNRIAHHDMPYKDAASRLAAYTIRLFNLMESEAEGGDWETIADLPAAVHKGLGLSYNHDRSCGLIVHRLLKKQLPDGSWATDTLLTDEIYTQGDLLYRMYRTTWKCLDSLRPMRSDILNEDNAALGLV